MTGLRTLLLGALAVAGCAGSGPRPAAQPTPAQSVERAKEFRRLVESKDFDAARAMMSADPRRWYEERSGDGQPWRIGPGQGTWAAWDAHFRGESEVVRWEAAERSAAVALSEINDYYRLVERGRSSVEIVYFFDRSGRIEGSMVRAVGERPPGRTDEFLAWARANDPSEIEYLMPSGSIDPTGDRPERHRALLNRWRAAVGLEEIPISTSRTLGSTPATP